MIGIKLNTDPTIAVDTSEIIIGDIITGHSKAFINMTHSAPTGNKHHEASIRVKVDTGAGGNILPLQLIWQMYPDQVDCLQDLH